MHDGASQGDWKILSTLGEMSNQGIIAPMTREAATDRLISITLVEEVLCPPLQPRDLVVMDNLSSHKDDGVRPAHRGSQAVPPYPPPYAPDLNPVEQARSKLKQILPQVKACTAEAFDFAIAVAQ